ncbi:uncharacterized protein B0I36DRAFT_319344 [Microdochium trichocladiopsis]|uniref:Carrier domain-containing protein n=1 Tax=Microdochium trichocladiopsis TaxID=1682393 RepID=A0A9P8YF94_9PEZI|nr:uncharacterized protein B0I36DRAFT_319344 [Microdochium trichocladiopsis]KAH7035913.1 hypothetical protein B0I36DRAFT_319344 [Microdochium trichocladiopsis]
MALSAKVSEAYVAQRVVELPSEKAALRLREAFRSASQTSAILRTRIVQVPGHGLLQVVVKDDFDCTDLPGGSLNAYLEFDRTKPVELGKPLVRYGVVTSEASTGKSHFALTMHHALYDGWCMPLIVDRVNRAYNNLTTERPAEFKHFIKFLGEGEAESSATYWRERLVGAVSEQFPPLPFKDYQQKADSLLEHYVKTTRPASGTTIATVIRGAWALLVSQYMGSDDVVFGETLTGRNAPVAGVDEIEGPMIATVPVRVNVDPATSVRSYLQDIHEQSIAAIPHEHFGLQHIRRLSPDAREACELRTGLVLHPSTDAEGTSEATNESTSQPSGLGHVFPFLNNQEQKENLSPADGFVPAGDDEAAQEALKFNTYGLMLVCSLDPQGFLIMASFDSKMVSSQQLEKMLVKLGGMIQALCEQPDASVGTLRVVEEDEISVLKKLSETGAASLEGFKLDPAVEGITHTWIVDPSDTERLVPPGAIGELVVQCSASQLAVEAVPRPRWLAEDSAGQIFRTKRLAKHDEHGKVVLVERSAPTSAPATTVQKKKKHVTATSAKQRKLRHAWSRIIGVAEDEISLEDSFFQLGGDSIGAMKLVSELRAVGIELSVANIFKHRTLYDMADICKERDVTPDKAEEVQAAPFSLLAAEDKEQFVREVVEPLVAQKPSKILDVLPTRPLQHVAVRGTAMMPRYSSRYELFHFRGNVDTGRLFRACRELVARNEILRTVFVEHGRDCYGVVLEHLDVAIEEYDIEGNIDKFAHKLCNFDVQLRLPLGSSFVKFFYVRGADDRSCLALRISHSQYDEICLVPLIRQLGAVYEGDEKSVIQSLPFSRFVYHTINNCIPRSTPYWADLLNGASLSVLRPSNLPPLTSKIPGDITRTVDISARSRDITTATLPTAAWALCLARRLGVRDVTFGEVVSGRNTDVPGTGPAEAVMGPTWQYIPVRVRFGEQWTASDLLRHVQHQHIASAEHQGMGLGEIIRAGCFGPGFEVDPAKGADGPESDYWFDTVVHQDVYHVEEMSFGSGSSGSSGSDNNSGSSSDSSSKGIASCRLETVYPHYEPLREWKIQAFVGKDGDSLMFEVVTFADWLPVAHELLDELEGVMQELIGRPGEVLKL